LRAASGALCGASVASSLRGSAVQGAIVGSAAAVGAAFVGREFRRIGHKQKWPAGPVALVEDAIAIGGAAAIISAI
jgi:hypothetical protein